MAEKTTIEVAAPVLGAQLLRIATAHAAQRSIPASCGSAAIDERVLDGGFRYGEITMLSGDSGLGKKLISYHAIVSHLIIHPDGEVAFVDTHGSFSPLQLRDVSVYRLRAQMERGRHIHSGYMYQQTEQLDEEEHQKILTKATSMLDRVKIMRVFDMAGLVETLGEIGDTKMPEDQPRSIIRRTEVADSDEDLEEGGSEDDSSQLDSQTKTSSEKVPSVEGPRKQMIIISSITNVISAAMARNAVQAQAISSSFMSSLHHLTSHFQTCTILLNSVVGRDEHSLLGDRSRGAEEGASIFASGSQKPALERAFANMIDTSIMLSQLPKDKTDAAVAFSARCADRSWRKAIVMEVLKDKCGTREGRWAAFEIAGNVKLVALFP